MGLLFREEETDSQGGNKHISLQIVVSGQKKRHRVEQGLNPTPPFTSWVTQKKLGYNSPSLSNLSVQEEDNYSTYLIGLL